MPSADRCQGTTSSESSLTRAIEEEEEDGVGKTTAVGPSPSPAPRPDDDDDDRKNNNHERIPDDDDEEEPPECPLAMGDHVYQWCSVAFVPGIYQHHGIVLDVYHNDEHDDEWLIKIFDFSNDDNAKANSRANRSKQSLSLYRRQQEPSSFFFSSSNIGAVRTYVCTSASTKKNQSPCQEESFSGWRTVRYAAHLWQRATWRAGTCTAVRSDPVGLVRARCQFLLEHPEVLPPYDSVQANCECVAVWCKTGVFATLQATSWLASTSASQIKSAVTVGGVAAATQVTVPSAGLWGWLGYTTHVPLLTAQPMLLPAICAYGVVTAGVPALVLAVAQQQWKTTTIRLNEAFWNAAVAQPDVFVECITYWSSSACGGGDTGDVKELPVTTVTTILDGGDDVENDDRGGDDIAWTNTTLVCEEEAAAVDVAAQAAAATMTSTLLRFPVLDERAVEKNDTLEDPSPDSTTIHGARCVDEAVAASSRANKAVAGTSDEANTAAVAVACAGDVIIVKEGTLLEDVLVTMGQSSGQETFSEDTTGIIIR